VLPFAVGERLVWVQTYLSALSQHLLADCCAPPSRPPEAAITGAAACD
jgi:hypothetical protein